MANHSDVNTADQTIVRLPSPQKLEFSASPPRILIIGAGNRGVTYARAIKNTSNGVVAGVVEPITLKRQHIGRTYIWGKREPLEGEEFEDYRQYVSWELKRRKRAAAGEEVPEGVDAAFICVQDSMHREVVETLAPLNLHIMCEKPLAPTLEDCVGIYKAILPNRDVQPTRLFAVGHVLRYTPHNMLLRKLLREDKVIGEIMAVHHVEPVGWNHFVHSFVRGNWRRESISSPSLLAKCCHDIDLLYWLIAAPAPGSNIPAHVPKDISSSGSLQYFRRNRKPAEAGAATNCLSCAFEPKCQFSAKRIYTASYLEGPNQEGWKRVVCPEIEECVTTGRPEAAQQALLERLRQDYGDETPVDEVGQRQWYGRCVYETDNDVCDNQTVTLAWEDEPVADGEASLESLTDRGSKTATLQMVAFSKKICRRSTSIYGTHGEIQTDGACIIVQEFSTGQKKSHYPHIAQDDSHEDGDEGLTRAFLLAIDRIKNHGVSVTDAQRENIGCSLSDIIMGHALVFAAEKARKSKTVVDFPHWWKKEMFHGF